MVLNSGAGEDSWESFGLQGDPTSPSRRKSTLNIHWKDWRWSWHSNTLATWCKEQIHWKNPDAGKDWKQKEEGTTKDEMVGWHLWLDGRTFEQALGAGDGQGSLACCSPRICQESDTTEQLNWTELPPSGFQYDYLLLGCSLGKATLQIMSKSWRRSFTGMQCVQSTRFCFTQGLGYSLVSFSLLFTSCLVGSFHFGDTSDVFVRRSRLNPLIEVEWLFHNHLNPSPMSVFSAFCCVS